MLLWHLHVQVARVREKILENGKFSRSGKSQGRILYLVYRGNLDKMKKVIEKSKFPKKMLVNRLLEILFSINGEQY